MTDKEAIRRLENCSCSTYIRRAIDHVIKVLEEVKGLRLLINWAVECGFGYDNIPEEYEKYKGEISGMNYTEGLVYIAMKEAEK